MKNLHLMVRQLKSPARLPEGVSLKLQPVAHFGPIVSIAGWLAVVRKPRANLLVRDPLEAPSSPDGASFFLSIIPLLALFAPRF
jgi:hypothetical protein